VRLQKKTFQIDVSNKHLNIKTRSGGFFYARRKAWPTVNR
jgi:hypothetical protein